MGYTMGTEHVPNLFSTSTTERPAGRRFRSGERLEMVAELTLPLAPGRYEISPFVSRRGGSQTLMDARDGFAWVAITGTRENTGLIDVAHEARLEPATVVEARE